MISPAKPHRPTGVTIIAILMILFGLLVTLAALVGIVLVQAFWDIVWESMPLLAGLYYAVLIFSILLVVFGAGLFTMKSWAWKGTVAIVLVHLIVLVLFILYPSLAPAEAAGAEARAALGIWLGVLCGVPLLIDITVLIYLLLPGTRTAFI
jgi:hypothetical protein